MAVRRGDFTEPGPSVPQMPPTLAATPEHRQTGESRSNGDGERHAKIVEDPARTTKAALEDLLGQTLPSAHPPARWPIHHGTVVLAKPHVDQNGLTARRRIHGRKPAEKPRASGFVLTELTRKLKPKVLHGVVLGRAQNSNRYWLA